MKTNNAKQENVSEPLLEVSSLSQPNKPIDFAQQEYIPVEVNKNILDVIKREREHNSRTLLLMGTLMLINAIVAIVGILTVVTIFFTKI